MTDTKVLLQKIAALRSRLDTDGGEDSGHAIEDKVQRGTLHNALIETTLRSAEPAETPHSNAATLRLTGRGTRLLRKGRELLQALRKIADDVEFQRADRSDSHALTDLHQEGVAMIEVVLRTVQATPASVSAQLRMCDGLEIVLGDVEMRIGALCNSLMRRKRESAHIDELADYLRALASHQPASLTPLQAMADLILEDAKAGKPLRFLYAPPTDPSRFAAAHSLTVAQVLARLLLDDAEWESQLQLALMAALVHDVGMTRVSADLLSTPGPLDGKQRRVIEKHTVAAESILLSLWPGGGWPVEAATCHHERNDGTGYPLGRRGMQLADYVRLLAVCDVYAALCCPRPHRSAFDTRTALTETLLLAEREHLDKASAERLLLLSFYPIGSAVELNDGATGLVVATQPGSLATAHPGQPIVHLLTDVRGQALEWPKIIDLREQKDRSILRALSTGERDVHLSKRYPHWI